MSILGMVRVKAQPWPSSEVTVSSPPSRPASSLVDSVKMCNIATKGQGVRIFQGSVTHGWGFGARRSKMHAVYQRINARP